MVFQWKAIKDTDEGLQMPWKSYTIEFDYSSKLMQTTP